MLWIWLDLLAQIPDMPTHQLYVVGQGAVAQHLLGKLLAGRDLPWMSHQIIEKSELGRSKLYRLIAHLGLMREYVEFQSPVGD